MRVTEREGVRGAGGRDERMLSGGGSEYTFGLRAPFTEEIC